MQVLIGTTNPSKAGFFKTLLEDEDVELVTPQAECAYWERLKAFLKEALE